MRNIKLTIQYDGTDYAGWQIQKNGRSIQAELEKALSAILGERIRVRAAGRTDAGVHALGQVVDFRTGSGLKAESIRQALNANLPDDISVMSAEAAPPEFDAQRSARSKIYRYTILNSSSSNPLMRNYALTVRPGLDVKAMREASRRLVGRLDFRSFQKTNARIGNTRRNIKRIDIKKAGELITIDMEADGFLYNMARNIAGTLIEVGRHKMLPSEIRRILKAKDRRSAGPTAPAKGLCLLKVIYMPAAQAARERSA